MDTIFVNSWIRFWIRWIGFCSIAHAKEPWMMWRSFKEKWNVYYKRSLSIDGEYWLRRWEQKLSVKVKYSLHLNLHRDVSLLRCVSFRSLFTLDATIRNLYLESNNQKLSRLSRENVSLSDRAFIHGNYHWMLGRKNSVFAWWIRYLENFKGFLYWLIVYNEVENRIPQFRSSYDSVEIAHIQSFHARAFTFS